MSFLKSGLDAVLARVLRQLGLEDATQLTLERVCQLDRQDQLDLGHQIGLEIDSSADTEETAERIWLALQAAISSDAPFQRPEPTDKAAEDIPWGYGQDRASAIAVDPNRLYVYWEVTDEAIAEARRGLGAGGDQAWLNLRVYDTSGRIFDGTNAHRYTDEKVSREDRQWFLELGQPGSDAIVEVGLKSLEGYFVKIARSGRVEFPRWGAPTGTPDWMTMRVRPEGIHPVAGGHGAPSGAAAEGVPASNDLAPTSPAGGSSIESSPSSGRDARSGGDAPVLPPEQDVAPAGTVATRLGERVDRTERAHTSNVQSWEGQHRSWSWESGPHRLPISVPGAVTERFVGGLQMHRIGERTHVVYGRWEVDIRGIDAHMEKTVLGRWQSFRSWVIEEGSEVTSVVEGEPGATPGSSEHVGFGASERRWGMGSETRLGGASETWRLGASERRLGGASEYSYLAASERMMRGASERMMRGASERMMRGASERMVRGASERMMRGASERLLRGASEQRFAGASEQHLFRGASDKLAAGSSERRFPRLPPEPEETA